MMGRIGVRPVGPPEPPSINYIILIKLAIYSLAGISNPVIAGIYMA